MFICNNEIDNTIKSIKTTIAFCEECDIYTIQDLKSVYKVLKDVRGERVKKILAQVRRHL